MLARPALGGGPVTGGSCTAPPRGPSRLPGPPTHNNQGLPTHSNLPTHGTRWKAGAIAAFGDARALGSPGRAAPDLVGVAMSPDEQGYWAVAASGTVLAFGDARIYGSVRHYAPGKPVAGIAATTTGRGYWIVSSHGGIFSFGDAHYYGSLGKTHLQTRVVAMAVTPDGRGYWLVTAGGAVYSFGDARFYGSLGATYGHAPVRGMAPAPNGRGYWLATASGQIYGFGDARYYGSLTGAHNAVTAIASATGGRGYWLLLANGTVRGFGTAPKLGSGRTAPGVTASALAPSPIGAGYVLATTGRRPDDLLVKATENGRADRRQAASVVLRPPLKLLGNFLVTCYDLTGITASGEWAGPQSVAVDPSVIPLGTQIYVQGIGLRTADDTGGAIIGDHVDIWEPTYYACADWGAQVRSVYRVRP